ncbi:DsbA family protein [Palleronia abyssalis]|uniref:Disulfide bond formation protein D n=1 Tax=Palleronia abyssalis TaxID=1501240 RepID=A0A2R8BUU7_9RHOB|nr:DsbA family protein [Palleronia abyssalis]SPJ23928.1 Disulfide bond formation protein D [Palleronia abyssalis]
MLKTLCAAALATGLALPAAAFDMTAMTKAERQAFGDEVRAYLLENPQVLMEAIAVLESREQQAQASSDADLIAQNAAALFDGDDWVGGNPDGDITVVEFLDYRCGYCRRAFPEVEELIESDGNIRLIVKEFPILGEQSTLASRFAIATQLVAGDDAYEAVHDGLMTMRADVTPDSLADLAEEAGLDFAEIEARMDSEEVNTRISETLALGQAMGVNGTPSFVFGDQMVRGYVPLDAMRQIVEDERG